MEVHKKNQRKRSTLYQIAFNMPKGVPIKKTKGFQNLKKESFEAQRKRALEMSGNKDLKKFFKD